MRKVVLSSVLALLIIASLALGYFYYQQFKVPRIKPINAVPLDAAFFMEFKNIQLSWQNVKRSIFGRELFDNETLIMLDSLFHNEDLLSQVKGNSILISTHVIKVDDIDFLYLFNLPKLRQETFVKDIINNLAKDIVEINSRNYYGVPIKEVNVKGTNKVFTYAMSKGIFMGSFTAFLVEDAIRQLRSDKPIHAETSFEKVYQSAGDKVDLNLFVNYRNLPKFISTFFNSEKRNMKNLSEFASWSGVDANIKSNLITLNGFTISDNNFNNYIDVLQGQQSKEIKLLKILPGKTAFMFCLGLSDFKQYYENFKKYLLHTNRINEYNAQLNKINARYSISVESKMLPWMGDELALIITEPVGTNYNNNAYAIFHANDIELAKNSLRELNEVILKRQALAANEEIYKGYSINFINLPGLIPLLYGDAFKKVDKMFYTIIDDYVIIGNQASAIRNYIDDFKNNKTLLNDNAYKALSDNIASKTNLYLYFNISRSINIIKSHASGKLVSIIDTNINFLKKFNAFTYQVNANNNNLSDKQMFYQNALVYYGGNLENEGVNLQWEIALDTSVSLRPQAVKNHINNSNEIIVQDDKNNLYLISSSGELLWKVKLTEKIMGEIHQIDFYKNEKLQYLFNTASQLHLIDRNGKYVANYPIKLPSLATSPLSVFDYEQKREYRMFVACNNNVIYAFQADGKPVEGWSFSKAKGQISRPVQHFKIAEKDYLLTTDSKGNFFGLDRRGAPRINITEKVFINPDSEIELEDKDSASYFVAADTAGHICKIYLNGNIEISATEEFSQSFSFLYKDLNGDQSKDYIFLEKNKLVAYNQDITKIFIYTFEEDMANYIQYILFPDGKTGIGVLTIKNNEIYLIDSAGSVKKDFPVKGNTPFTVNDLDQNGYMDIIVGCVDKKVCVYTLN